MPYSAPWMTNRCRCSPPQPNAVCTMVCRSATVLSPETSSRRQISGLTACSTARNRYTPGDAAGSDTTSPVGTSSSGTAPSSPLAMLATVVRVAAGARRGRRPPAPTLTTVASIASGEDGAVPEDDVPTGDVVSEPAASPGVYRLRAVLHAVSPLIWRRLLVSGESTVADLHTI